MPVLRFPDRGDGLGESVAFICRGSTRRRADCQFFGCRMEHVALCDFPVTARGRRCSKRMCEDHRTRAGDDLDLCPDHMHAAPPAVRSAPPLQVELF